MKKSVVFPLIAMFTAILSGCILSKTPNEDPVLLTPGVEQTFTLNVFPGNAKFTWMVDGVELAEVTGNSLNYAPGDDGETEHIISVKATSGLGKDNYQWNVYYAEAAKTIGPAGGTVEVTNPDSPLYKTKVEFLNQALAANSLVYINGIDNPPPFPTDICSTGPVFNFHSDVNPFQSNVIITLPYPDSDNDGVVDYTGASENNISVRCYNESNSEWEQVQIVEQNKVNKTVTIATNHFSQYAVTIQPLPSDQHVYIFTIDGLSFSKTFQSVILGIQLPWAFRKSYLQDAIVQDMNLGLTKADVYSFGSEIFGGSSSNTWDGDSEKTPALVKYLVDCLRNKYIYAINNNKKFILVTHSWGNVLGMLALQYCPDVIPDLIINLSNPMGSNNVSSFSSIIFYPKWFPDINDANVQNVINTYINEKTQETIDLMNPIQPGGHSFIKWINYWDDGDIISGPLNNVVYPPQPGNPPFEDRVVLLLTQRDYESTSYVHALTSLSKKYQAEYNVDSSIADSFRNRVKADIMFAYHDSISTLLSTLVPIPAGTFQMGSTDNEYAYAKYTTPVHTVTLQGFYMGAYEVTQAQYAAIMGSNPSYFQGTSYPGTENNPVEQVSWYDAREFCTNLSALTGRTFTLPSEAQWEYACRAGSTTLYSFGDDDEQLDNYAWYDDAYPIGSTHLVGTKFPNAWGLYDMHGNVWEWCLDSWHSNYTGAPTDGSAWEPETGSTRIYRGGGYSNVSSSCRSAFRLNLIPGAASISLSFRVVAVP